jgi:hypothetical protein
MSRPGRSLTARDVRAGRVDRVVAGGVRRAPRARYLPIAEHGLIGDLHTVALVGTDGTIDWYCCPRFDSPSVFAAILDADHGGLFRISPDGDGWSSKQLYLPDANILITRFLMPDGVGEVQDFMPPPRTGEAAHHHRMIRRVLAVRGQVRFVVDVAPRFDYARARHQVALTPEGHRNPRSSAQPARFVGSALLLEGGPLRALRPHLPAAAPGTQAGGRLGQRGAQRPRDRGPTPSARGAHTPGRQAASSPSRPAVHGRAQPDAASPTLVVVRRAPADAAALAPRTRPQEVDLPWQRPPAGGRHSPRTFGR